MQRGLTSLLEECFHKILLDKETIDKFRIFFYNLMAMELDDSRGKKSSLLDLMLTKAVARKPSQREDIKAIIESRGKPAADVRDVVAKSGDAGDVSGGSTAVDKR